MQCVESGIACPVAVAGNEDGVPHMRPAPLHPSLLGEQIATHAAAVRSNQHGRIDEAWTSRTLAPDHADGARGARSRDVSAGYVHAPQNGLDRPRFVMDTRCGEHPPWRPPVP